MASHHLVLALAGTLLVAACAGPVTSVPPATTVVSPSPLSGTPAGTPAGMPAASSSEPSPSAPPAPPASALAAPPVDCVVSAPPGELTFPGGLGFQGQTSFRGGGSVWAAGLPDDGVLHLASFGRSSFGYPSMKVMWLIGPGIVRDVTLVGHDVGSGSPMRFEIYPGISGPGGETQLTETASLDPFVPNRDAGMVEGKLWSVWGIGLDFAEAGCYELTATFAGGSWSTLFAVGA